MVREETRARGITMIFDEVMTRAWRRAACRKSTASSPT